MKKSNLNDLTVFIGSAVSSLVIFASPAFAFTFGFCGQFTDGAIPGGRIDGTISVDDQTGEFLGSANITTKDVNGNNQRVYTQADFQDKRSVSHPTVGDSAYRYTFWWNDISAANRFEVYIPTDFFPVDSSNPPALNPYPQFEYRNNVIGKDPDRLRIVPEPTTILGSMLIGGGITLAKKKLKK